MGGFGIWEILILLLIILVFFVLARYKRYGRNLGAAFMGFKSELTKDPESITVAEEVETESETEDSTEAKSEGEPLADKIIVQT